MPPRNRQAGWFVALSAAIPVVAAVAGLFARSRSQTGDVDLLLGGAAFLLAGLIWVPTRAGFRRTAAYGVAAAIPLVKVEGVSVFDWQGATAALLLGVLLIWFIAAFRGPDHRALVIDITKGAVVFASYLAALQLIEWQLSRSDEITAWIPTIEFAAAAGVAFVVEVVAGALLRQGDGGRLGYRLRRGASDVDAYIAIMGAGALFGLTFEQVQWWALVVAVFPYAFTHAAFHRLFKTKRTYTQTLRALARIPEVAGHSPDGHAVRTAELSRAVALDLGLRPKEVDLVEMAGLMHDVGRVTLNEPGIIRLGYTDQDLARWGAEIIRQAPYLAPVAEAVERQHDAYRLPGVSSDPEVPMASRVIRVTSRFLRTTHETGLSPLEAMEDLHQGSANDYDPTVVGSLRRVLERRGSLHHPVVRA